MFVGADGRMLPRLSDPAATAATNPGVAAILVTPDDRIPMNALLPVCLLVPTLAASLFVPTTIPQDPQPAADAARADDRAAVTRAALDYVEALYEAKPELIERSVHAELKKLGFYRPDAAEPYRTSPMTYERLVELAATWNDDGSKADAKSPKKVDVLDVMDVTAVVKLTAAWGVDHMQLGKFEGRWKIVHILWQSHPK